MIDFFTFGWYNVQRRVGDCSTFRDLQKGKGTMLNIEIYPLEKIVIDGIPVYLGMEQAAVEVAISTENNADIAKDMRRANHWATIGIGIAGYYR